MKRYLVFDIPPEATAEETERLLCGPSEDYELVQLAATAAGTRCVFKSRIPERRSTAPRDVEAAPVGDMPRLVSHITRAGFR
jgi:hypothetical protein